MDHTPVRTHSKNGKLLKTPAYLHVNATYSDRLRSAKLEKGQAAIYGVTTCDSNWNLLGFNVGQTRQSDPIQRPRFYVDTVAKNRPDPARTITSIQELGLATEDKTLNLVFDLLEICDEDERLEREQFYIQESREMGLPVLNRT